MASWLDNYREASYNGVPFFVASHVFRGGKRGKTWEFPFEDKPYNQVLGLKVKRPTIEGYLIGDDYIQQRNTLMETVDSNDDGLLVHPYFGEMFVVIYDYEFRETDRETRMVRFTLQCTLKGELQFPVTTVDTDAVVASTKQSAFEQTIEWFDNAYKVLTAPLSKVNNVQLSIEKASIFLEAVKTTVSASADYIRKLNEIRGNVLALSYDGRALATDIIQVVQFGTNFTDSFPLTIANSEENFYNMVELWDFTLVKEISEDTQDIDNLFKEMFILSATIAANSLLSVMPFSNYEKAIELRNIGVNQLDLYLESEDITDDLYNELYGLRAQVVLAIEEQGENLPRLAEVNLPEAIPALVLSHSLYQTVEREQDLIDRNDILDPAFTIKYPMEVLVYE